MKKILHNLRQNWITYGFETLVVILGILGAFGLNNWNEGRKSRDLEAKYLRSLTVDLEKDLKSFELQLSSREKASRTALKLLQSEEIPRTYEDQLQFQKDQITVHFWWDFNPNDNTFKELVSSGNLSLIESDKIKKGLLNLESLHDDLISDRDHLRREYDEYLYDELIKYQEFPLLDFKGLIEKRRLGFIPEIADKKLEKISREANQILKNQTIRNGWQLVILNNSNMLDTYEEMILQIMEILNEIEAMQL